MYIVILNHFLNLLLGYSLWLCCFSACCWLCFWLYFSVYQCADLLWFLFLCVVVYVTKVWWMCVSLKTLTSLQKSEHNVELIPFFIVCCKKKNRENINSFQRKKSLIQNFNHFTPLIYSLIFFVLNKQIHFPLISHHHTTLYSFMIALYSSCISSGSSCGLIIPGTVIRIRLFSSWAFFSSVSRSSR